MRRTLLIVSSLASALTILRAQPILRADPALDNIVPANARVEKVQGNLKFTEGPLWIRSGGYLLFSDLMQNAILKLGPDGMVSVYRGKIFPGPFPEGVLIGSNGLTLDHQGRIIAAEHGNRRLSRFEKNGTETVLADRYEGKRFNSPNDVVVKRNGDIYFTDPPGLYRTYPESGSKPRQELDFNGVYRIGPGNRLDLLTKDVQFPNGIAFSPDEKKLYVASTRPDKYWMVFDVAADGTLANGRKFFDVTKDGGDAGPDGMKVDTAGNIYGTAAAGVMIFSPEGRHLGTIPFPEVPANVAWGDADGKTLYVTARTGIYKIKLKIAGIRP